MDIIEIVNLRLRTVIGFSAHELHEPQDVVINLRIGSDSRRAGESDNPADAYNYKTVAKAISALVEGARFSLLEKLAEEIACRVTVGLAAPWVEVSVYKPGALRRSDSVGIRIERRPTDYGRNVAFITIGSNIAAEQNIVAAVARLRRYTTVLALSQVYRTEAKGFLEQAPFLNMAAKVHTWRSPLDFKQAVLARIEAELKRERDPANRNAPRTIDLDIALWNDAVFHYGAKPWTVPDPEILQFAHLAVPLADIAPDAVHPESGDTLRQIADSLEEPGMEAVKLDFDAPMD